jgi:hypothetical protein
MDFSEDGEGLGVGAVHEQQQVQPEGQLSVIGVSPDKQEQVPEQQ